jgi:uncharacterized protein (DUF302 family)
MSTMGMQTTAAAKFDDVLARLPELLKAEGFGVLTTIDVQSTLRKRLGVTFRRYRILGACNPKFALQALGIDLPVGVMLPCNVIAWEGDDGRTVVTAVDRSGRWPGGTPASPRWPTRFGSGWAEWWSPSALRPR